MSSPKKQFEEFACSVSNLCSHFSVREDENGPYIFALGLKETHTLQMRKVGGQYILELWHGRNAEVEKIVSEPKFSDIDAAFSRATEWLERDAI
jgi:hypothetical protein